MAGSGGHKYGFNDMFSDLVELEAVDIPEPGLAPNERTAARVARESEEFRPEHYMADLMGEDVAPLLTWQPPAAAELRRYLSLKAKAKLEATAKAESEGRGEGEKGAGEIRTETVNYIERELTPGDLLGLGEPTPPAEREAEAAAKHKQRRREQKEQLLLTCVEFPEAVIEQLIRLPNRDYLLDNEPLTLIGLADLLFAYW